jgi:hypothetical protein
VKGLFNSEIHHLVREVDERLNGVFVTYALSSGASPDLRDAVAAARFSGCDSAVVIPAGADDVADVADGNAVGDWLLTTVPVHSDFGAPAVIDAYLSAIDEAGKAA